MCKNKLYRTAWYDKKGCYVSIKSAVDCNGTWYYNVHNKERNIGSADACSSNQEIVTHNQLTKFCL